MKTYWRSGDIGPRLLSLGTANGNTSLENDSGYVSKDFNTVMSILIKTDFVQKAC
jgi:hypothetical protein